MTLNSTVSGDDESARRAYERDAGLVQAALTIAFRLRRLNQRAKTRHAG